MNEMRIFFSGLLIFFSVISAVYADGGGKMQPRTIPNPNEVSGSWTGARVKVVATLFPQFDFAREIGKDRVEVSLLLPPGVEAHEYEPRPQDIARINRADIFLYTGKYMEPWVASMLKGIALKKLLIIDTSNGVTLYDKDGIDPHIWLDLDNAQAMVDNICEGLVNKDSENRVFYLDNAREYKDKLKALDAEFKSAFAGCKHDTFIYGGHFAFGYFTRRYHLKYMSAYKGASPDSEPTPGAIMELVRTMRKMGLRYVYYEEIISPRLAGTIAGETGAGLLPLNSAHNVSKRGMELRHTFISIMKENLENLKKGLECRQTA